MALYESLFDEKLIPLRAHTHLRALPTYRDTGWRPLQPHQWPDLTSCSFISHDTENKETDFDFGPGWARGHVTMVGHSLTGYWRDGTSKSLYLPMRHEIDTHLNLDPDKVTRYVRDMLHTPHIPKGYANGLYDVGTSTEDSIYVQGELHEIQFAEALISEDENVALDVLAKKYLGEGKDTNELYEWCAAAYGGEPTGSQRGNIYRAPPSLVGPYAEQDAALIRPILWKQWSILNDEQLVQLYRMECKLIRLLVRMRLQGVRIDLPYTEKLRVDVQSFLNDKIAQFKYLTGIDTSESCPTGDIANAFQALNIPFRITEKTKKPSITSDDLKLVPHPVAKLALEIRQYGKIKSTFIDGALLGRHVNGIVHGSLEPLRNDEGGTRSGRFSSNNPNLQNIPVRTEMGKKIRKAFVPFFGHAEWSDKDYSQYEYRLLAHCAVDIIGGTKDNPIFGPGPSSNALREQYRRDPDTDYHTITTQQIKTNAPAAYAAWEVAGLDAGTIRKRVKTVNFGMMNLMGLELLCSTLSIPVSEGKPLLEAYHKGNPYIKATVAYFERQAREKGYSTTLLGRRSRFNLWEPRSRRWIEEQQRYEFVPAFRYQQALAVYGSNIQRARAHIALNRRTQGDNADGIKMAMVMCDEAGIFDVTGVPTLTVHDSLSHSVIDKSPRQIEAHAEMKRIMSQSLPVSVPIRVDDSRGPNWGDAG
jgi:DNA polymerase I-like protein with 3'-5' exonuclease and polymerase domains